jgi:hypothetical protein
MEDMSKFERQFPTASEHVDRLGRVTGALSLATTLVELRIEDLIAEAEQLLADTQAAVARHVEN